MFGKHRKIREVLRIGFGNRITDTEKEKTFNRIALISIYHKEMTALHGDQGIDGITWSDLQMDDVFACINHTQSFIGEQYFYHRMHQEDKPEDSFEKMVQLFSDEESFRLDMQERLASIGKNRDEYYYLPYFLMHSELWKISNLLVIHLMQILLVLVLIAGFATGEDLVFAALIPVCLINLMIYLFIKSRYESFLFSFGTLRAILDMGMYLRQEKAASELGVPEEILSVIKDIGPLSKHIRGWHQRKTSALYGELTAVITDYLFGITLMDVAAFNHLMKLIDGRQDQIMELFQYIGTIDVCISVASYRKSLDEFCVPVIKSSEGIRIQGLVHPLLEKPVENDFKLSDRAIITGANAAGKSTFLKALAINMILAKAVHTCTAHSFQMPDVSVMTSMALRDDVITGESYYIREAKRLKAMLDRRAKRSLLIVDEMLKGTNTSERVAASIAILSYLAQTNHFVIVATHDLVISERLKDWYQRFYFDVMITEKAVCFDYKIHEGYGGRTNAIELLSLLDYPEEIVVQSKKELVQYNEN